MGVGGEGVKGWEPGWFYVVDYETQYKLDKVEGE